MKQLAQVNIARMLEPLDSPLLRDFVENLESINALADAAPGFIWRLVGEGDDATSIRPFDDDMLLVNLSVWQDLEALKAFVYRSPHAEILKRRREWFSRMDKMHTALWWVPEGYRPAPAEAKERLETLWRFGPSAQAFTFAQPFAADAN